MSNNPELVLFEDGLEAIQPMAARYHQLTTVIVRSLRQYYSSGIHWLKGAEGFRYDGDRTPSTEAQVTGQPLEIFRSEDYRGDVDRTSVAKLVVRRNAVAARAIGIGKGQRMGAVSPNISGRVVVAREYVGSGVVFALAKFAGESGLLAAETEQYLQHYSHMLQNRLQLKRLAVSQIGETGEIEEFPGFFATPILLDYIYEDNIELVPGQFQLRKINFNVEVRK